MHIKKVAHERRHERIGEKMLTNRTISLLQTLLSGTSGAKINDLANIYSVSQRVIYYDIAEIAEFVTREKLPVTVKVENGVLFLCGDDSARRALKAALDRQLESVVLTPEERALEILYRLLSGGSVRVSGMMESFDVSKSTVVNDMDRIKRFYKEYGVTVPASAGGFVLTGGEIEIHLAACRHLASLLKSNNVIGRLHIEPEIWERRPYNLYLSGPAFAALERSSKAALKEFELPYSLADKCICSAMVSLARRTDGGSLLPRTDAAMLSGSEVYRAAERIASAVCPAAEDARRRSFAELLALDMICSDTDYRSALAINRTVDLRILAANFCAAVCSRIGAAASEALIHDIKSSLFQIFTQSDTVLPIYGNHVLLSLQQEYMGLYRIVQQAGGIIATALGRPLTEPQVVYLMLNFIDLYEKYAGDERPPDVLLVCSNGTVVSRLLSSKLQLFLEINVVDVISSYDVADYLQNHTVDYIISTVPVLCNGTPCIMINPLLTKTDIKTLWEVFSPRRASSETSAPYLPAGALVNRMLYLNEVSSAAEQMPAPSVHPGRGLAELVPPGGIVLDAVFPSLEDAVRLSGQLLEESGCIDRKYIGEITRAVRENGRFMLIGPGVIMPHSIAGKYVKRTGISVLRLKTPLPLEDADMDVKWIFTLCTTDKSSHLAALSQLANMIGSDEIFRRMESAAAPEELRETFCSAHFSTDGEEENV